MRPRAVLRNSLYRLLHALTGPGRGVRLLLLYHSVGSDAPSSVPVDTFVCQMRIIADRFRTVLVRDLPSVLSAATPDANVASVTFDDGYLDNFERAVPVLNALGINATFFIATGYLGRSFRSSVGNHPMMGIGEVRELRAIGHEIGAHSLSHPKLTEISPECARIEIDGSKHCLEDVLGDEVTTFAYPRGAYNETVKALVHARGFRVAVSTQERLLTLRPDWMAVPRIWVSEQLSLPAFAAKLSPAVEWYERVRSSR